MAELTVGKIEQLDSVKAQTDEHLRLNHQVLPTTETIDFRWFRAQVGFDRSDSHLSIVRDYPCIVCDAPAPSEPHHICASYGPAKTSDYATIPVCRSCHEKFESDNSTKQRAVYFLALFHIRLFRDIYQ